jgi:Lectin C-type domain
LKCIGVALAGLLLANASWADSPKIQWNGNSHYYKRFDELITYITWNTARFKCEALKGHLATITSADEEAFIVANILEPSGSSFFGMGYFIGGLSVNDQWQWVTGETWNFTNWDSNRPTGTAGAINIGLVRRTGAWDNELGGQGYICEWSYRNFLSSAVVPDINKNGASEFAAMYRSLNNSANLVDIKDMKTSALLGRLSFPGSVEPPLGMVVLKNIETTNATPELAVLISAGTSTYVQIKDVLHDLTIVNNIAFLDGNYKAKTISVSPDTNRNGADEISVLGIHKNTGKAKMEMRDSKTQAVLRTVLY